MRRYAATPSNPEEQEKKVSEKSAIQTDPGRDRRDINRRGETRQHFCTNVNLNKSYEDVQRLTMFSAKAATRFQQAVKCNQALNRPKLLPNICY